MNSLPEKATVDVSQVSKSNTQEPSDDPAVQSAVKFLSDPRIRHTTSERKIAFLKSKGLSSEQVSMAFRKTGQTITVEHIDSIPASAPAVKPVSVTAQSARYAPSPNAYQNANQNRSHTLFPSVAALPLPSDSDKKWFDWRDVVIGVGAACMTGLAAIHLLNRYSPYEFRRKDDGARLPIPRQEGRRRGVTHYSGSEAEPAHHSALPLPEAPANATLPKIADEEATRLQGELAETREALTNERKRNAEMAINAAKLRKDQQKLSHTNDKLMRELDELKAKMNDLDAKKNTQSQDEKKATHEAARPEAEPSIPERVKKMLSDEAPPNTTAPLPTVAQPVTVNNTAVATEMNSDHAAVNPFVTMSPPAEMTGSATGASNFVAGAVSPTTSDPLAPSAAAPMPVMGGVPESA